MCPACLATISMIVVGVISSGGTTALAVKALGRRNPGREASGVVGKPREIVGQNAEAKEKQT